MRYYNIEQGSDEWYAIRAGKVTASNFGKAIAQGQGKTRNKLMYTLIAERIKAEKEPGYSNAFMEWGTLTEPLAREEYEKEKQFNVQTVGFCALDDYIGASPDGLIGDYGLLEIKCPDSPTHIENILTNKFPTVYKPQVQGQLWVTGRQWCDFVSFDPRILTKPLWSIRVERDEKYISELKEKIYSFVDEMKSNIDKIIGQF